MRHLTMFSQKKTCLNSLISNKIRITVICLVITALFILSCFENKNSPDLPADSAIYHKDYNGHYYLMAFTYLAVLSPQKKADNKTEIPDQGKIIHQNLQKESKKYRGWVIGLVILSVSGTIFSIRQIELSRYKTRQRMKLLEIETKKLKELDQLRSRFFANISHEFRTPLTLIMGPLEQLLEENKTGKNMQKKLYVMHSNAQKLKILINQLLDLSKIESGSYPLKASRGNLTSFLEALTVSFASQAEQKNIKLELKLDPSLKTRKFRDQFYFDRNIFEKIIINLLSNAFKFSPEHSKIEIRACFLQENGNKSILEIRIKDNGPGISEQKLPYIFDRFFQADEVLIRDYEGSGIGLAFVRELTSLHYGQIWQKVNPTGALSSFYNFPWVCHILKKEKYLMKTTKPLFIPMKSEKHFHP
jgi:signal transduction histidine kinase